jgi:hypothetical protein
MIMVSWLFDRARGGRSTASASAERGPTTIKAEDDEDADDGRKATDEEAAALMAKAGDYRREVPNRKIYCVDLRVHAARGSVYRVKRIARENSMQLVSLGDWIDGSPKPEQLQKMLQPMNDTALGRRLSSRRQAYPPLPCP